MTFRTAKSVPVSAAVPNPNWRLDHPASSDRPRGRVPVSRVSGVRGRTRRSAPTPLARPIVVAPRRALRPLARVGQLAHLQPAVRERLPVHARDVGPGGRPCVVVGVGVAAGAAVQGVRDLAFGRGQLARMAEHFACVRAAVTPCA